MELHHKAEREGKLLTFLRRELNLSSSLVKRLKWQKAFCVNGAPVHTDHLLRPGDDICVRLEEALPEFPPQDGHLDILFEDEALLAVDKPPEMLMHPSFYQDTGTLANFVAGYYQKTAQPCAVHPVSRLDRDTFGVVLLAKNAHVHGKMMALLQSRQVQKTYEALVFGCPAEPEGLWDFPIAKKDGSLLREVQPGGQQALTRYRVMEQFGSCSRLELEPVTGRTHQLRVHCAHAGCPILGDPQYGTAETAMGFSHQQLCAVRLTFPHPLMGKAVTVFSKQKVSFP